MDASYDMACNKAAGQVSAYVQPIITLKRVHTSSVGT